MIFSQLATQLVINWRHPERSEGWRGRRGMRFCEASWGDASDQMCVRDAGHGGVHIDAMNREWGYVAKGAW